MPTSTRQIKPILRNSNANSMVPNGTMWASPPTHNREFLKNAGVTHQLLHAYRLFLADGTKIQADAPKEFERALECQRTGREK